MTAVSVEWLKWPDSPYRRTPMTRLGQDEFGVWLFAPRGAEASYTGRGPSPLPVNFLTLVPAARAWWVATWMWGNLEIDIDLYVDIVHPPEWASPSVLRVVDLDLDVIRRRDGSLLLDDEGEFAENAVSRGYPRTVVAAARRAADDTLAAVGARRAPLGIAPRRWFEAAQGNRTADCEAEGPLDQHTS